MTHDQTAPLRPPTLLLEKLAAGELTAAQREALKTRYALSEDALSRHVEAIHQDNEAALAALPPELFAKQTLNLIGGRAERARSPTRSTPTWWQAGFLLAAGAAALLLTSTLLTPPERAIIAPRPDVTEPTSTTRTKGATSLATPLERNRPSLKLWRLQHPSAKELSSHDRLEEGDIVQLEYDAWRSMPGAIFSVDGRGVVTLHHPERASDSARLEVGSHRLPYSYTLDDAPAFERFLLLVCDTRSSVEEMHEALKERVQDDPSATLDGALTEHCVVTDELSLQKADDDDKARGGER